MASQPKNTRTKEFQKLFDLYVKAHPDDEIHALDQVYPWACANGLYEPPREDPARTFRRRMAKALAQEHRTDSRGRRHRSKLPVTVTTSGGKQQTFWADIDQMPPKEFQKNVAQRRNQIVADCVQLSFDVDHYNDEHPAGKPIQLVLDFEALAALHRGNQLDALGVEALAHFALGSLRIRFARVWPLARQLLLELARSPEP